MYGCVFKQKTGYEVSISDWSSDVCSSDLYSRLVNTLINLKDFSTAEQIILEQTNASPNDYRFRLDLGNRYNKSGHPDKAKEQFRAVLKNLPEECQLISEIERAQD